MDKKLKILAAYGGHSDAISPKCSTRLGELGAVVGPDGGAAESVERAGAEFGGAGGAGSGLKGEVRLQDAAHGEEGGVIAKVAVRTHVTGVHECE